jgi:hypothetical protein
MEIAAAMEDTAARITRKVGHLEWLFLEASKQRYLIDDPD